MDRETNPGFVFCSLDLTKEQKKCHRKSLLHMEGIWSDCVKIYSGRYNRKNVLLRSYLDSRYGGKESTEVSTIEKFLFSKSGAL
jgi:hypothetical protein